MEPKAKAKTKLSQRSRTPESGCVHRCKDEEALA